MRGVSARQARRLLAADQQRGIAAVVPGNRGRVPVNVVDEETRQAIIAFATERYVRFNQVHRRNTWASSKGSPAHGRACDAFLGQRGSAARARGARRHTAVGGHGSRVPGCACRLLPARTTGWKDAGHGGRCAWRLTGARWAGRRGKCWRCSAAPMTTAGFMVPAAEEGACYRVMAAGTDRDPRLCFKDQRTVGMDNTVRFGGERLPLLSGPHRR